MKIFSRYGTFIDMYYKSKPNLRTYSIHGAFGGLFPKTWFFFEKIREGIPWSFSDIFVMTNRRG